MKKIISTGIDIGSSQVKVVITEFVRGSKQRLPRIIGTGISESKGLRHGYLINSSDVTRSVRNAIIQAEKQAGTTIDSAYLAVGGVGLSSTMSTGTSIISRADSEITQLDIEKALEVAEESIPEADSINKKIIHSIPLEYKIDDKKVLGSPLGMKGIKIEIKALFVTAIERHIQDLIDATEDAGININDVTASPIAASFITLTKAQKVAGCVLANIGAETLSIVVYENNIPVSLEVFPIGSTDITNDIALGLKISLEDAEEIKQHGMSGSALYPRKKLDEIVTARLSDMFELVEKHLESIGRNGLLPAGIILTGGGSGITTAQDLAKSILKLPARIASLGSNERNEVQDAFWSVAYGLCVLGLTSGDEYGRFDVRGFGSGIIKWLKQFLP